MKATGLLFSMLLFTVTAAASLPSEEKFQSVQSMSKQLGYRGHDTVICLDGSGKMVLGGISAWHTPLQIFLVEKNGKVVKTQGSEENQNSREKYSYTTIPDNKRVDLVLMDVKSLRGGAGITVYLQYKGFLMIAPQEIAQSLTCYMQNSGLE